MLILISLRLWCYPYSNTVMYYMLAQHKNTYVMLIIMTKQLGLRQLITEPTRYSPVKDTCKDLFFTNSDIIANVGVGNVNISDHQMIILTRKKAKMLKQQCEFIGRSYRNYNNEIFQKRIRNANWQFFRKQFKCK